MFLPCRQLFILTNLVAIILMIIGIVLQERVDRDTVGALASRCLSSAAGEAAAGGICERHTQPKLQA